MTYIFSTQGDNNSSGQDSLRLMTSLAGLVQHPSMPELALRASEVGDGDVVMCVGESSGVCG